MELWVTLLQEVNEKTGAGGYFDEWNGTEMP